MLSALVSECILQDRRGPFQYRDREKKKKKKGTGAEASSPYGTAEWWTWINHSVEYYVN